ncbi:MAG: cell division protein FtsA, partial [Pseudomonadota bacterium]
MSVHRPTTLWETLLERAPRITRPFGILDVGSRKLCCYVVRLAGTSRFELLGAGDQLADGFVSGDVVDAQAAEASIRAVVDQAERSADERLRTVAVTFSGGKPASGYVQIDVGLDGRTVQRRDVTAALDHACAKMTAEGFSILHALPLGLALDGGPEVRDVTGLVGRRLTVRAHLVGVSARPLDQLAACLRRCHLEVSTVVSAAYG